MSRAPCDVVVLNLQNSESTSILPLIDEGEDGELATVIGRGIATATGSRVEQIWSSDGKPAICPDRGGCDRLIEFAAKLDRTGVETAVVEQSDERLVEQLPGEYDLTMTSALRISLLRDITRDVLYGERIPSQAGSTVIVAHDPTSDIPSEDATQGF